MSKSNFIYTPTCFKPKQHPGPIADHPEAAKWLLNVIYFKTVTRKLENHEWVTLRAEYLHEMMGDSSYLKPVREALAEAGLIEVDRKYVRGQKSMGYRLGPALKNAAWKKTSWAGKVFVRKVEAFKESLLPTDEELGEGDRLLIYRHLESWLFKVTLPDDLRSVFKLWDHNPDKQGMARHRAELIRAGFITFTPCPYGRFHSNFTLLNRELRKRLILIETKERLVSLDIANSQSYFLLNLLPRDVFPPEYVQKAVNGVFNDDFKMVAGVKKEEVKDEMFKILFGNAWHMDNSKLTPKYKELYPTVFKALKKRKREAGKFQEVARSLQRMESDAIILGACGRLYRDHPEVPVISVHDNLITTRKYEGLVRGLMLDECEKVVGLRPTIKD